VEGEIVSSQGYSFPLLDSYEIDELLRKARRRAKKMLSAQSRALWMKAFFAASCAKDVNELRSIINEVSSAILTQDCVNKKKAITAFFTKCYKELRQEELTQVAIVDNILVDVTVDYRTFWLFFAVPRLIFNKCKNT